MQGLRGVLPLGGIWTPIFDELVLLINTLQSQSIDKISFYKLTTGFVEHLKETKEFDSVHVTGHS